MTYDISFQSSGPVAASGEYLITFDPTKNVKKDTTDGLSVLSFSDTFATPALTGFNYVAGSLTIGGLISKNDTVGSVSSGTNDYFLVIDNFRTTPTFAGLYIATSTDPIHVFIDSAGSLTVSPTPEPSSLALLGTGLLGVVGAIRRRLA